MNCPCGTFLNPGGTHSCSLRNYQAVSNDDCGPALVQAAQSQTAQAQSALWQVQQQLTTAQSSVAMLSQQLQAASDLVVALRAKNAILEEELQRRSLQVC